MEDHTLVEEREELMVPPSGGNPTFRKAHFLKPIFTQDHLLSPPSLLSSKPTFQNLENYILHSYKRYPSEKWKVWVQSLKPRYQEIWKKAGIYDAILASTHTIVKDKNFIIFLAERWCVDTNTFVFPWGEVTITLEDVVHLGCFSVLGASFLSPLDDEVIDVFNCLKNAHKKIRSSHSRSVTISRWMDYFKHSDKDLEHEAFLAFWLSRFVLVRPPTLIALQDFRVAIHLSRGDRIALAPVVLACIYRDMRVLHNLLVESSGLESRFGLRFSVCHYDLVQMWVWERFMEVRPLPNVIDRGEPRSARWNELTSLAVSNVRTALDNARSSFLWRPYAILSSNSMLTNLYKDTEHWIVVDSDAEESFARCLRASQLVGLGYTEQYLPHRVAMQFGLDQDIPPQVVQSSESPASCYDRPIRGAKLYIPPRLFESDVSSRYVFWWTGEEVVTSNIQNEKQSLLVSCGQKRNVKSSGTTSSLSGCVKERTENYGVKGGLSSAEHMSPSRKTDIFGKRIDLDDDPVLDNNYDKVEEDNLTIAQILNQSTDSPGKRSDPKGDPVLNNSNNNVVEDSLTIAQFLNRSTKTDSPEKKNEFKDFPVLDNSFDNVKEDSLMIAQFLNQSRKRESFEKARNADDDLIPETITPGLFPTCHESPKRIKRTSEPVELSVQIMSSSDEREKSRSSTKKQTEPKEDAVLSSSKMSVHSISSSNEHKQSKSSSERQTELDAAVTSNDNIISMNEKCYEDISELQHLGLKNRIWRLETIVSMIKAAKFGASSSGNLEK